MTVDEIMEQIRDNGGLDHWCVDCPEKGTYPGCREGGVPIDPDEEDCPCGFEIGEESCNMHARYKEVEVKAAELADLICVEKRSDDD